MSIMYKTDIRVFACPYWLFPNKFATFAIIEIHTIAQTRTLAASGLMTFGTMKRIERKKRPDEIEIDIEDVQIIMGDEFDKLHICLETTFCGECPDHNTTIENYKIYLDKLNDLVFVGQCMRCKGVVVRIVETGETKDTAEVARYIKMIKKEYRTTKKI